MSHSLSFECVRTGRSLSDDEIAGMMIGLLLAGQHTSSTTSAWMGFFLAQNKDIQVKITHSLRAFIHPVLLAEIVLYETMEHFVEDI